MLASRYAAAARPGRSRRWAVLRRAASARLAAFGAAVTLTAVLVGAAAPLLAPYDPLKQNLSNTLARPGRTYLLGSDNVGRDVLSRLIWGTRISLVAGVVSVAMASVAGSLVGLLAGIRVAGSTTSRCV
jgi:peptide/nickel transport system permease protein